MKNRITYFILIILSIAIINSCETINNELTPEEIVEGLKTALEIGAESATNSLSAVNGYYGNSLVKIPLPDEAEYVRDLITDNALASLFNLEDEFENVVLAINKAAEEAASDALPIFEDAITEMSITDGLTILYGTNPLSSSSSVFDSTAATSYFRSTTYEPLTALYSEQINDALDIDLGLEFSATEAWTTLTSTYNSTVGNAGVQLALTLAGIDMPGAIDDNLGEFCTHKALDGLFYMIGEEEKKIRKDPWAWASDIIEKVFGSVFKSS